MQEVVLITGASRGIGAATARRLAARGVAVGINHSDSVGEAEQLVREIRHAGGRAVALRADVGDEQAVTAMFEAVDRELGPLTGLVNNAGVTGTGSDLSGFDPRSARRVLDVNVVGMLLCTQAAATRMSTARGGRGGAVVNVSSVSAQTGGAGMLIPYAASKAAVNAATVGLGRELAPQGIRVNAVMPGIIDTTIHERAGVSARMPALLNLVPMARMGSTDECAAAIDWLLGPGASYVTGAVLPVTGGR